MIVLVDDHDEFRAALAEHLRDDGFAVREYGTPGELPPLDRIRDVSLVITDYQMPGEDGLSFADRFHASHPSVPVLLVTAHWQPDLQTKVLKRDFLYLFCKPVDYMLLARVVEDLTSHLN